MPPRELIAQVLGHEPRELVEIDDGYDYEVAIAEGWVFRFPRRPVVELALRYEIGLLPVLAAALPVEIPRFEHVSEDPPFAAYRLIEGTPLRDEDPDGVLAFLRALHAFDHREVDVERRDWIEWFTDLCGRFERDVLPLVDRDLRPKALELFAEVPSLAGFEPALVHADLGPSHLLVRDGRLAGVIDWGDARVGDPALDYAWLLNVPFPHWEVDDELRRRARFYHRLGPWHEAHHGLRFGIDAYVRDGLAGIVRRLSAISS
jgi:aminoglycoside phosphotransferase (APT) family kinase protein